MCVRVCVCQCPFLPTAGPSLFTAYLSVSSFPSIGLSTARRKPTPTEVQNAFSDRPSSRHATMWMGSDTGV